MRVWEQFLQPEELEVYRRAGYGKPVELGQRPALLVVDVEYDFTGDGPEPILDSIAKYKNSCGPMAWESIPHIRRLIGVARRKNLPVIYTHSFPRNKDSRPPQAHHPSTIVDEIAPLASDLVIEKEAASPFFGTSLITKLVGLGVDTLIHTGCTTSGCVRAGVVDGASFGFKNIVVLEAVFDRAMTPHWINLFDMDQKYAGVVSVDDVVSKLENLPSFNEVQS